MEHIFFFLSERIWDVYANQFKKIYIEDYAYQHV